MPAAEPTTTQDKFDAQLADCQRMTPLCWFGSPSTLREITEILRKEIEQLDGVEYFGLCPEVSVLVTSLADQPLDWTDQYRWLACYAVTGGSEGWYIHVELIHPTRIGVANRQSLMMGKTFSGYDVAARLAGYIGARLQA